MTKPNLDHLSTLSNNKNSTHNEDMLAQLETELAKAEDFHDLESTVLNLSDYLQAVQMVVKHTFDHSVWVKAEIRNLSSKGGHYYFELAEKDDNGKVIASCRGTLWKFKAERVLNKFSRTTGSQLTRDLTVLIKVTANMHPQYGFSLNIEDIDPSYTLGDLARQYAAMVERLTGEGLMTANKQIPTPFDIEQVLVIAPENAAGLGDFRAEADKLDQFGACHFHYQSATFQGNHAPTEIRHAIIKGMNKFEKSYNRLPDILVIIRGGGAVGDLAYLNDYELAALVAEQPIPVWVGIGHERDKVILDEVAHTSFDTPSKVIAGISNHLFTITKRTQECMKQIEQLSKNQLQLATAQAEQLMSGIKNDSQHQLLQAKQSVNHQYQNIEQSSRQQLKYSADKNNQLMDSIKQQSKQTLHFVQKESLQLLDNVKQSSYQQLLQAKKSTDHLRQLILLQHPNKVLEQGYAIVKNADKTQDDTGTDNTESQIITSSYQLHTKQNIKVQLKDGFALANIYQVTRHRHNVDNNTHKIQNTQNI